MILLFICNWAAAARIPAVIVLFALHGGACRVKSDSAKGAERERIAALKAKVARLQSEAQAAEDSLAIKRLQHAYGYYVEKGLWNQLVDLYTDDATIEFGNEGVYAGKPRIREYYKRLFGNRSQLPEGFLNTHLLVMPLVDVAADGQTAHGRWKDIVMKGEWGRNAFWGDGIYENEYRKEGGVWKISRVHRYTTFVAPYDGGWVKAEGKPDISIAARDFPPDAPPTFKYEPFPGVFIPPFHPNPYVPERHPLLRGIALPGDRATGGAR